MTLEEIKSIDLTGKNVAILGIASAGKTWLSNELAKLNPYHLIFHGDHYMEHGFENSVYILLEELKYLPEGVPIIVEGILAYRLLRKGLELHQYKADVVITCEISKKQQQEIYTKERNPAKLKHMQAFELGNMKVFNDYQRLLKYQDKLPEFYYFHNNY